MVLSASCLGFSVVYKSVRIFLLPVPLHALVKLDATPSKHVQRTADSKVDFASTQLLHQIQILQVAAPASIRDRDGTPFGQLAHQRVVDALLQTLVVRGVDQELGAVWFEELDRFCVESVSVSASRGDGR